MTSSEVNWSCLQWTKQMTLIHQLTKMSFQNSTFVICLFFISAHRFRDFTIAVGNTFDSSNIANFDPTTYTVCANISGSLLNGGVLDVICDPPLEGKYLTVHMVGVPDGGLEICEVLVFDHPGKWCLCRSKFWFSP